MWLVTCVAPGTVRASFRLAAVPLVVLAGGIHCRSGAPSSPGGGDGGEDAVHVGGAAPTGPLDSGTPETGLDADGSATGSGPRDGAVDALAISDRSTAGDAASAGSAGCGNPQSGNAGSNRATVLVGGTTRTYLYTLPAGYSPTKPIPLGFGFHGRGGDSSQGLGWGIGTAAANAGQPAIFIYPDGAVQGSSGTGWDESKTGPDVALYDALVAWAESNYCIDSKRIFVAGFSWGTDFGNALGCFRGAGIRAINGFSGGLYSSGCTTAAPAYRATYSTPDGTDAYSQADFNHAVTHYTVALGCGSTTAATTPSPCVAYQGCAEPVIFCAYPNMGHAVPPNGGADAWAFFSTFK
jgi:polyhydroxybutyrate depolymerase